MPKRNVEGADVRTIEWYRDLVAKNPIRKHFLYRKPSSYMVVMHYISLMHYINSIVVMELICNLWATI